MHEVSEKAQLGFRVPRAVERVRSRSRGPARLISVAVVDPVMMMRESLAAIINRQRGLGLLLSDALADKLPLPGGGQRLDVVILGVPVSDNDCPVAVRVATPRNVEAPRIVFLHEVRDYLIAQTLELNVRHIVSAYDPPSVVVSAVRSAVEGKTFFGPSIVARLKPGLRDSDIVRGSDLTERQRQLLAAMVNVASTAKLATVFGISKSTIQYHRARLLDKLGLRNSTDLMRYAIREKMAEL